MAALMHRLLHRLHGPFGSAGVAGTAASVAVMLAIALLLMAGPSSGHGAAWAATTSELNQKLEDTRVQLEKVRAKIAKSEASRKAAVGDIAALDKDIDEQEKGVRIATNAWNSAADRLVELQAQLKAITKDLTHKQAELRQTETDLQTQQGIFDKRLANVYKSGGRFAYMVGFLQPGSIAEVVTRIDLLSSIVNQDNTILSQIKDLKARVASQKQALEQQRAEVASVEQQQKRVTQDLQAKANARKAALDDLETARRAKQKVVDAAASNQAAWSRQEEDLLAESNRIKDLLQTASVGHPTAGKGVLFRPVPGAVTSPFGMRMHPIFHVMKMHTGVDMHAGMSEPIYAAAAGTVVYADWRGGYGKCVIIDHGNGLSTLYGHQSEILVRVGQKVKRGEVIGRVGSTGYSTGPHLHFEVRVNGSPVDPMGYL
ncbi:MAG: peptidoglycan DD-metalloendopeptidase family protein [Actinobacteria bacterium]|nr:peptidoglycan DD-metalloendopeptidase family protein [Actinomycetota bacterium]